MEYVAYTIFIVALALPFLVAAFVAALLLIGLSKIYVDVRRRQRLTMSGIVMTLSALAVGVTSYQWWLGPPAEYAKLEPLVVDKKLAAGLPRIWVFRYGAEVAVFDIALPGYADRVLNSRRSMLTVGNTIPTNAEDPFMEELKLADSSACKEFAASKTRDANRMLECVVRIPVVRSNVTKEPYLLLSGGTGPDDAQFLTYSVVRDGQTLPIARCIGRAPRETNPILGLVRRDRSLEVASSMYRCKMRAASGSLARVLATGEKA